MRYNREPRPHELTIMAENLISRYPSLADPVNPLIPDAPRVGDLTYMLLHRPACSILSFYIQFIPFDDNITIY